MNSVNVEIAQELDRAGIPVVLLDRCIHRFPQRSHYDLVGIEKRSSAAISCLSHA